MNRLVERWRAVSQLHESERLQAWVLHRTRPLAVWLTPPRRRTILALLALADGIGLLVNRSEFLPDELEPVTAGALAGSAGVLLGGAYLLYRAAAGLARLGPVRRHPQLAFHGLFWGALAVSFGTGGLALGSTAFGMVLLAAPTVLWRAGYLLASGQRGHVAGTRFRDHFFTLFPVYAGTNVPFGKGLDYLRQREVDTPEDLVRCWLAGAKLLLLSLVFVILRDLMDIGLYGDLDVPRLMEAIRAQEETSLAVSWGVLYLELVRSTLQIATVGHLYIGALRIAGFRVFRNTYKPLLSETILDFWNRYYYYFKELLVDFFFFPVYLRLRRAPPVLRIGLAIFAAAFVGNVYFHLMESPHHLMRGNFERLWLLYHARVFYCLLLALGIWVSMLRQRGRRGATAPAETGWARLRRVRRIALVLSFYALIEIWASRAPEPSFGRRVDFFLGLFGLPGIFS